MNKIFLNINLSQIKNSLKTQANGLQGMMRNIWKKMVSGTGFEPVLPP